MTESHLSDDVTLAESEIPDFTQFRADRINRKNGGVINYVHSDLSVSSTLSYSNSYCETQCLHIPSIDTAVATIYRPPGCPTDKFREAIEEVRKWLASIENPAKPLPTFIMSGDFNFSFMENWDTSNQAALNQSVKSRQGDRLAVAQDKLQANILLELVEEHMLIQFIKESTHDEAILDLAFSNNEDIFDKINVIENVSLSDHRTIVADMTLSLAPQAAPPITNFTASSLPNYDLTKLSEAKWEKVCDNIQTSNWTGYGENQSVDVMFQHIIDNLESSVSSVASLKGDSSNLTKEGKNFQSKNKIPQDVRILLWWKL